MSRRVWFVLLAVTVAVGIASSGCRKGTPTTCKGWAKLLKSPVKGRDAIKNLGDLHCAESLKELEEVFASSQYKEDILQTVKAINAPKESADLVIKGLKDPYAATLAAAVAEDFALPEFRTDLLAILGGDQAIKARENALKALRKIDKANPKQDEDIAIQLLKNDPNIQGITVNALAAQMLGEMKSEKAVPQLVVALFIRTQRGEQLYTPVRKTLAKIGKAAVAPLVAILTGDSAADGVRKELQETGKKLGMYEWQWVDGPEVVQVLGDLRDTDGAEAVAKSLSKQLNPPVGVDDRVLRTWQVAQQNRITMCMMSLWNIGTPAVVQTLKATVNNGDNDAKQRLDTASALSLLPGFAGQDALMDIFKKETDSRFRAPLVKPIVLGLDWAHMDAFLKMVQADKSELVKERVQGDSADAKEFASFMSVLKECKEGDLDCLIGKLKGDDLIAGEKAAILMSNMKGGDNKKAVAALVARYPEVDPVIGVDLRRFILLSIWRLGDKSNVADLEKMLQSDKDRKGAGYWIDEIETFLPILAAK